VVGWTIFAFYDRQDESVQLTRYHNMGIRCLINDFYHDFITSDHDMVKIKRCMGEIWTKTVKKKPQTANKPSGFEFSDDMNKLLGTPGFEDYLIAATSYMRENEATHQIRQVMDLSKPRFVLQVTHRQSRMRYLVFLTTMENQNPLAVIHFDKDRVAGAVFLKISYGPSRLRDFFWITSTDEEHEVMNRAILRAIRQLEAAADPR